MYESKVLNYLVLLKELENTLLFLLNIHVCEVYPLHETEQKQNFKLIALSILKFQINPQFTNVISRLAAAADICKDGCLTELLQSNARANVPTDLDTTKN